MRQPVKEGVDRQNVNEAEKYFRSCLRADEYGLPIYPDTCGGDYFDDDGNYVIAVTTEDLSEYQFLQDEFPCIVFEQVKYSYNYPDGLVHEYLTSFDPETETVYAGSVFAESNCAVIFVDEKTLAYKTNAPDSALRFEWGFFGSCVETSGGNEYGLAGREDQIETFNSLAVLNKPLK